MPRVSIHIQGIYASVDTHSRCAAPAKHASRQVARTLPCNGSRHVPIFRDVPTQDQHGRICGLGHSRGSLNGREPHYELLRSQGMQRSVGGQRAGRGPVGFRGTGRQIRRYAFMAILCKHGISYRTESYVDLLTPHRMHKYPDAEDAHVGVQVKVR